MNAQRVYLLVEQMKHACWIIIRTVLIVGLSFVILYPLVQKVSEAFKDPVDIYDLSVVWIPKHFTLANIKIILNVLDYGPTLLKTFLLCAAVTLLQTAVCALAGYTFARLRFPGSNLLFACAVFTILVPPQTIMVPLYIQFQHFDLFGLYHALTGHDGPNLLGSYWPLLVATITGMGLKSGLFIYIFRQFFRGLPKELEEAAFVDGSGIGRTFFRIALPISLPAIVTVMLFTFVWQWNDTFFTNTYMGNMGLLATKLGLIEPQIKKILTGDANLLGVDPFHMSMLKDVAVLFMMLPLIVMYLFVQRYFVESVERTGLIE